MQKRFIPVIKRHTLWISLLLHLLFLLNFSYVWFHPLPTEQSPSLEISSYVYNAPTTPTVTPSPQHQQKAIEKPKPKDKNGIEKYSPDAANSAEIPLTSQNVSARSFDSQKTKPTDEDPIHLIGESKVVKPLIKILGRALTAHLVYPKIAIDFNLRGTVHIGFLLSPNGQVSNAEVVKSSGTGVLDDAALRAVNEMSPVPGVNPYLPQSKFLVIGIIFG